MIAPKLTTDRESQLRSLNALRELHGLSPLERTDFRCRTCNDLGECQAHGNGMPEHCTRVCTGCGAKCSWAEP
jgi:hypothetical protein